MSDRPWSERRRVERRKGQRRREGAVSSARRPLDQRQHTRYEKNLPVRLFRRGQYDSKDVMFEAGVDSVDISVGGVFLRSTFFLKKGLELELQIDLEEMGRVVHISGEVARVIDDPKRGDTGFAIRFTEYHDDAEIYLRAYLTQGDMIAFVEEYAKEILPGLPGHDRGKLVELIVRWEIYQEELQRG